MAFPLAMAGLGGLSISGVSNLYAQSQSRALYRRQINAYKQLQDGYVTYLRQHGRHVNPARLYERYGAKIDSAGTNLRNSYLGSIGTAGGTFGAGTMLTQRWL